MGWSELIYTLCLIGYMQAMPLKLLVISTLVNALVLGVKWIWDF
jgi:hypothetical protein